MYKEQFAITRTVGNQEDVLRYFEPTEKDAAIRAGKETAASNTKGVISCVLAQFDASGNMKDGACRIFEVWR